MKPPWWPRGGGSRAGWRASCGISRSGCRSGGRGARSSRTSTRQQALAHELEHLRVQRDALEAQILKVWDIADKETAHLATAEAATDASVARIAQEREDLAAREQRASAALAEVEAELQDVLAGLPARVTAKLSRLSTRYDNPVAGLAAGGCDACGQMLPQQQAIDVDHDRALPACTGCGRFIVARRGARRGEWM